MAPLISLLSPYASSLTSVLLIDYGIQALGFSISAPLRTEKLFDLAGAVSYVSAVAASVLFRPEGDVLSRRQVLAAAMTTLWAFRLGSFLFVRVFFKSDKRFDKIKHNTKRFALTWVLQGVWVYITALPVYILLANPGASQRPLQITDYVGAGLWATGFLIEAVADAQKFAFKNKHPHKFMSTGLFRYSRYPNYFGEITLWGGMFLLCSGGFVSPWQWLSIISPYFEYSLIMHVSGVKLLEKSSAEKYGKLPEFQDYVARTSKLIPWIPKKQRSD